MMHALLRQAVTNFNDDANNDETQYGIVGASAGIAQEQHVDRKRETKKFTAKEVEQFQDRVNATAARVKASEHRFGYVHVMRNEFELIRAGMTTSDLPDADVAIIRLSRRPDESPMKPYIDDMERLLDGEDQTVHLARLYVDALSALDDADNDFYRSIVPQLSKDAQRRLQKTYEDRSTWVIVATIDWVSLAEEFPKMTRHMIGHGVTSLKQGLERNGRVPAYTVMQSAAPPRD